MLSLFLALCIACTPFNPAPPLPVHQQVSVGTWSQYNKGPTDGQIYYHHEITGKLNNPEDYDGFVAVLDCEMVGRDAWILVHPNDHWLHVFVFDCSGHVSTTRGFINGGIIGELDYYLARELEVPVGQGVEGVILFDEQH